MFNEDLERELSKVRDALTNSIAVEKQIEKQIQKNNETIESWDKRARMAHEAGSEDMALQAEERMVQLKKQNTELTVEHLCQKDFSGNLKKDLSKMEARRFNSSGPIGAEALAATENSSNAMDRLEHKVQAQEIEAKLACETHDLERQFEKEKKDDALDDELNKLKESMKKD